APSRPAVILDRPRPRYPIAVRRIRRGRRLCAPRTVVPDRMALARDGGGPAPGLLEARWRRLATPRLRPVGAAGAAPAGHPRELARGRCLLPGARSPTGGGGRMGGGRGDPAGQSVRPQAPLPLGRSASGHDACPIRRLLPRLLRRI